MNRFEALHALGLEDGATDDDIRLAYYGLEKSIGAFDFSQSEQISRRMNELLENAQESRKFLLKEYEQAHPEAKPLFSRRKKVTTVTPTEEKLTRLHAMERVRTVINNFLGDQISRRSSCIIGLIACAVVGFVLVRGVHGVMRFVVGGIILAIAVALSFILSNTVTSAKQSRAYLAEIDAEIFTMRDELGLVTEEELEAREEAAEESPHWWVRLWKRICVWWNEHRPHRFDDTEEQ